MREHSSTRIKDAGVAIHLLQGHMVKPWGLGMDWRGSEEVEYKQDIFERGLFLILVTRGVRSHTHPPCGARIS